MSTGTAKIFMAIACLIFVGCNTANKTSTTNQAQQTASQSQPVKAKPVVTDEAKVTDEALATDETELPGEIPATEALELPSDWPIESLSLPNNAVIARETSPNSTPDLPHDENSWEVDFDAPGMTYQAVIAHIESCLRELGYYEYWYELSNSSDSRAIYHQYYSPDGLISVWIEEGNKQLGSVLSEEVMYEYSLRVRIYETPRIDVDNTDTSDSEFKFFLEPLQ